MLILQTTPISFLQQGQVAHCHFQLRLYHLYHLICNCCTQFTATVALLFLDQVQLPSKLSTSVVNSSRLIGMDNALLVKQ
jgi:hypothetical protein